MKTRVVCGVLLAVAPLTACAGASAPPCDMRVEVSRNAKGVSVSVDASNCQADVSEFVVILQKNLNGRLAKDAVLSSLSVMGPVGVDNLEALSSAWGDSCEKVSPSGVKTTRSGDFLTAYSGSKLSVQTVALLRKYGKNWEPSAVENFYPVSIRPGSQIVSKRCRKALLLPVVWFSQKRS